MRTTLIAFLVSFGAGSSFAADTAKPPSEAQLAQQERFKACNADAKAKSLKGDERRSFMSDCLKKKG